MRLRHWTNVYINATMDMRRAQVVGSLVLRKHYLDNEIVSCWGPHMFLEFRLN